MKPIIENKQCVDDLSTMIEGSCCRKSKVTFVVSWDDLLLKEFLVQ